MIKSFCTDPFRAAYFLPEELGKVSHLNQVMLKQKYDMVLTNIDHIIPREFQLRNLDAMGMRFTTVADRYGSNILGVSFITNIIDIEAFNKNFSEESNLSHGFIYIPSSYYECGDIVFIEDIYANVFLELHSFFDENLKYDKHYDKLPNSLTEEEKYEVKKVWYQNRTIYKLVHFFGMILNTLEYGPKKRFIDGSISHKRKTAYNFVLSTSLATKCMIGTSHTNCIPIYIPEIFALTSIYMLLENLYPGFADDIGSFDKKIARPMLAQYLIWRWNGYLYPVTNIYEAWHDQPAANKIINQMMQLIKTAKYLGDPFNTSTVDQKWINMQKEISKIGHSVIHPESEEDSTASV